MLPFARYVRPRKNTVLTDVPRMCAYIAFNAAVSSVTPSPFAPKPIGVVILALLIAMLCENRPGCGFCGAASTMRPAATDIPDTAALIMKRRRRFCERFIEKNRLGN